MVSGQLFSFTCFHVGDSGSTDVYGVSIAPCAMSRGHARKSGSPWHPSHTGKQVSSLRRLQTMLALPPAAPCLVLSMAYLLVAVPVHKGGEWTRL